MLDISTKMRFGAESRKKNESTLLWREKQDFQSNDEIKLDQHIL